MARTIAELDPTHFAGHYLRASSAPTAPAVDALAVAVIPRIIQARRETLAAIHEGDPRHGSAAVMGGH